ncbi:hydrolase [Pinirhizobacter sp.]|jgi:nicotinamidase-related amidase|uniref:hydrolase n=1 Tax=Pinirhizobacter sp. TaxID=2950432 RepID=UPI002F40AB2F
MADDKLDPGTTALVLIDLQAGIIPFAKGPYTGEEVVTRAARLVSRCRDAGTLVVRVSVGFAPDFADALKQPVDQPNAARTLPDNWWADPEGLPTAANDIRITKRQWGAFYGTELDLQLRRRGIRDIILGGISTNIGVESTARSAFEHGYGLVLVEDAMSSHDAAHHHFAVESIFPRIGRVRSTEAVLAMLG